MRIPSLRLAAFFAALFILPSTAQAQWTTGSVSTSGGPTSTAQVDYAVYGYSGYGAGSTIGSLLTAAGITPANASLLNNSAGVVSTSTALAGAPVYLYVYEVVYTQAGSNAITQLLISNPAANIVAGGYVSSTVFSGTPTQGGTSAPAFTTGGTTSWAYYGAVLPPGTGFEAGPGQNLTGPGQTTTLEIEVSYIAPTPGQVYTQDGSLPDSGGLAPVAGAEPGTFVLLGLALPVFGFGYVRKLRNRLQTATATVA